MSLASHLTALAREKRTRLTRWILAHRIRARHPTLVCDPTAIWDYGYHDIDAIEIGEGVTVEAFVEIIAYRRVRQSTVPGRLILGDGSLLGTGVNVRAAGGTIRLGACSGLSQNTIAVAANHDISGHTDYLHGAWNENRTGVEVGDNVWVGACCVLLPGTRIGSNAVIAAGTIVHGEVPAGELWGGAPARRIRSL